MRSKGARLYLRAASGGRPATWIIRDGELTKRTGCGPREIHRAEEQLVAYVAAKRQPDRTKRSPSHILIRDVINIYLSDIGSSSSRPKELGRRSLALLEYFGDKTLSQVNGSLCRAYVKQRGSISGARRELEDLRAAINHHRREGLCSEIVEVVLPPKSQPRERWITRSEAARLIWAAWRFREKQNGFGTPRASRKHIARFIIVGLYTGTRAGAICGAAFARTPGRGYIDLDNGIFYRRAVGASETKKRQPPIRIPERLLAHLRRWRHQKFVVEFNGKPVSSIRKAFARVVADAGLEGISPHTLRHTAVTWTMQGGADLWEAAGYFGMTAEILESVYGHHSPNHGSSVMAAIRKKVTR